MSCLPGNASHMGSTYATGDANMPPARLAVCVHTIVCFVFSAAFYLTASAQQLFADGFGFIRAIALHYQRTCTLETEQQFQVCVLGSELQQVALSTALIMDASCREVVVSMHHSEASRCTWQHLQFGELHQRWR